MKIFRFLPQFIRMKGACSHLRDFPQYIYKELDMKSVFIIGGSQLYRKQSLQQLPIWYKYGFSFYIEILDFPYHNHSLSYMLVYHTHSSLLKVKVFGL